MIHFESNAVYIVRHELKFFFFYFNFQFFQHNLLERHSFLRCIAFIKNQLSIYMRVYFWTLYSVTLLHLSNMMSVSCSFYHRSIITPKTRWCKSFNFILFQSCFAYSRSMNLYRNFRINLPILIKKSYWYFVWDCLNIDQFWENWYFNNIEFSDLWTKYIFQFIHVIKNFFQCFVIFNVQVFDIFCQIYPNVVHIFCCYYSGAF